MENVLAFKWNNNEDINLIGQWNPLQMKYKAKVLPMYIYIEIYTVRPEQ